MEYVKHTPSRLHPYPWPEPGLIHEAPGLLEIPLTGFVCKIRLNTSRLVGFIQRDMPEGSVFEPTFIAHMPSGAFKRSMVHALAEMENAGVRSVEDFSLI